MPTDYNNDDYGNEDCEYSDHTAIGFSLVIIQEGARHALDGEGKHGSLPGAADPPWTVQRLRCDECKVGAWIGISFSAYYNIPSVYGYVDT